MAIQAEFPVNAGETAGHGARSIITMVSCTVPLEDEMKKMYSGYKIWDAEDKTSEFPKQKALYDKGPGAA